MIPAEPIVQQVGASHWDARLALRYERSEGRSVLAHRAHSGPLRVQRDLYPEGPRTCHTIVVHPPGGIAGGDALAVNVALGPGSAALLTTPGAGKWYRSQGPASLQSLAFDLAEGSSLEWLPQETILFDGAVADLRTRIDLAPGAQYIGWEIFCFGRAACGERYARGRFEQRTEVFRAGERLWTECARLEGDDPLFASPVGLAGRGVCATLLAAGADVATDVLTACGAVAAGEGALAGVTRLPGVLIARWLGAHGEDARRYVAALWAVLRPALRGIEAVPPRIWAT